MHRPQQVRFDFFLVAIGIFSMIVTSFFSFCCFDSPWEDWAWSRISTVAASSKAFASKQGGNCWVSKKAIVRREDYSFCFEGLVLGCIEFGSSQITLILQDLSGLSSSTIFTFMYCSNTRKSLAVRQMFWYFLEMVAFCFLSHSTFLSRCSRYCEK